MPPLWLPHPEFRPLFCDVVRVCRVSCVTSALCCTAITGSSAPFLLAGGSFGVCRRMGVLPTFPCVIHDRLLVGQV